MTTRIKWILGISLVLNIFLIGGIAGGIYRWRSAEGAVATAPVAQRALRFAAEGLPPEHRRAFRQSLLEARREVAPQVFAGRESRRELGRLLSAPDYDATAVEAQLAKTRAADVAVRTRVELAISQFASTLPAEERQKFAQSLAQRAGPLRVPADNATPAASTAKP